MKNGKDINEVETCYPKDTNGALFINTIFPKNSPLAPIFSHSLLKLHEKGSINQALKSFIGPGKKASYKNDAFEVLTMGQCFLGFAVLVSAMFIVMWIICLECCFAKIAKES